MVAAWIALRRAGAGLWLGLRLIQPQPTTLLEHLPPAMPHCTLQDRNRPYLTRVCDPGMSEFNERSLEGTAITDKVVFVSCMHKFICGMES